MWESARGGGQLAWVLGLSWFLVDGVAGGSEQPLPKGAAVEVLPPFGGG